MPRIVPLQIAFAGLFLATSSLPRVMAEETAKPAKPVAGDTKKEELLKLMLAQAKGMIVRVPSGTGTGTETAKLRETPLIKYSDQERALTESSLWMWQQGDVPVLFCKVERMTTPELKVTGWQFCCTPAVDQKVDVEWSREFRWRAKDVGFHWITLADKTEPGNKSSVRLAQLKSLARQFSGDIENSRAKDRETMRLLSQPLYQYTSPKTNVLEGAVFGLTSNGTNPDTLLVIEALKEPTSKALWRYAVVGMSGDAVNVYHDQKTVWSKPFTDGPGDHRSWMWYVTR